MSKKAVLILFFFGISFFSLFSLATLQAGDVKTMSIKNDPNAGGGWGGGGGSAGLGKGKGNQAPKGSHQKNIRPSTKEKHQKADGRRQREQKKAEEKERKAKIKNKVG